MSVAIEYKPEYQAIIATHMPPYDPVDETQKIAVEIQKKLDSESGNIHLISDLRAVDVSFSDLVQGMAAAFRKTDSVFTNDRLKTHTVGDNELVRLGAKAASEQKQYGHISINLHTSVEDALAAIKK